MLLFVDLRRIKDPGNVDDFAHIIYSIWRNIKIASIFVDWNIWLKIDDFGANERKVLERFRSLGTHRKSKNSKIYVIYNYAKWNLFGNKFHISYVNFLAWLLSQLIPSIVSELLQVVIRDSNLGLLLAQAFSSLISKPNPYDLKSLFANWTQNDSGTKCKRKYKINHIK